MNSPALAVPTAGSSRYFVLLYCPPPRRRRLHLLFAIVDEIVAGLRKDLDHQIAQHRLAWWCEESERLRRGQPAHPYGRELLKGAGAGSLPTLASFDLDPLLHAAAAALAQVPRASAGISTLPARETPLPREVQAELFPAIAQILSDEPLSPEQRHWLTDLGGRVHELELAHAGEGRYRVQTPMAVPPTADLAALAPLCVWAALAARRAQRRDGVSLRATFADNILAWRAARAAVRGKFQLQ